eukprot:CAMPEP_0206367904 /NCGR_PEP_ID=MMETSP0294-20121207/4358_1 /ASSEMBLY_ACC=CAM_ASM_000327 /TAXON_ID=39354 /ORGANISM="Heterosigma akashiwo, Strain CCMP2393" /LENGTH=120 /DNA_ID=CAMNT_0053814315 /DNA_START=434 /DNA_END=796 /DNA_ORIENTATION=+
MSVLVLQYGIHGFLHHPLGGSSSSCTLMYTGGRVTPSTSSADTTAELLCWHTAPIASDTSALLVAGGSGGGGGDSGGQPGSSGLSLAQMAQEVLEVRLGHVGLQHVPVPVLESGLDLLMV